MSLRTPERQAPAESRALERGDFRCVASQGFGDRRNSYPHAMAWHRGHLYVATTRNILQLVKIAPDPAAENLYLWPVPVEPGTDAGSLDQRCQIWRYAPERDEWRQVFESPLARCGDREISRDFGYRNMIELERPDGSGHDLYVTTMSSSKAPGAHILRCEDGVNFHPVTDPGMGDTAVSSYRALIAFRGRLYTSPAGNDRLWAFASSPVVFETTDVSSRRWRAVSEVGFGDRSNLGIFAMATFAGHLYAATVNADRGYQIYKTDARGEPPYRWRCVVTDGAFRGRLNQTVMTMHVFDGALYVGSGIRRGGFDREFRIGPAAAELIRIHSDDTWDLIAGTPRLTPQGEKRPLSGLGAGFDNPFCAYIWSMANYDSHLYVGTFDSSVFLWHVDPNQGDPDHNWRLRAAGRRGLDRIVERQGGFDLWRSNDGLHFERVSGNGFGNPYNYGVRSMVASPHGLFVGAANPFGPEVAARTPSGWAYVDNPRSGLEVWLGAVDAGTDGYDGDAIPQSLSLTAVNRHYDTFMFDCTRDEYVGGSDFANFGYWEPGIVDQRAASENLMERLLSFVPRKRGRVLDVACGRGATTRHLLRYYPASAISGVNISTKQLESCRSNAPGCDFRLMSATDLDFDDESFSTVICVEAAFHFDTREDFLREAWRVLEPGGWLVLSDILGPEWAERRAPLRSHRNHVRDPEAYRALLRQTGFAKVHVEDATRQCWGSFYSHVLRYSADKFAAGEITPPAYRATLWRMLRGKPTVTYYVLAAGRKVGELANHTEERDVHVGT